MLQERIYWVLIFQLLVHSPYSFPEVSGKGFAIGTGKESFIAVSAQYTERFVLKIISSIIINPLPNLSTDAVKSMTPSRRKCLLRNEDLSGTNVTIKAFSNYSRPSCLLECRAVHLLRECGCLPYYFPDFSKIWKVNTTCDLDGLKCVGSKTSKVQGFFYNSK